MSEATINNNATTGLLGEIVSWTFTGCRVPHAAVTAALRDNGLDDGVARAFCKRHAFTRAVRAMATKRLVRKVDENADAFRFQFTAEAHDDTAGELRLRYDFEAILTLDKTTGQVTCAANPAMATLAQAALDAAMEGRTPSDLNGIVQRLFNRHADLFRIRPQGGCYFVPQTHAEFSAKVAAFCARVGGSLQRLPVAKGTPHGDGAVRDAVQLGLSHMIGEYKAAVANFDINDTRAGTFDRMAERLRVAGFKIEAYAEYLADAAAGLHGELAAAKAALAAKLAGDDDADPSDPTDEDLEAGGLVGDEYEAAAPAA